MAFLRRSREWPINCTSKISTTLTKFLLPLCTTASFGSDDQSFFLDGKGSRPGDSWRRRSSSYACRGKRKLQIPPQLACGPEPAGCFSGDCTVPGKATLLYDINFVDIYPRSNTR